MWSCFLQSGKRCVEQLGGFVEFGVARDQRRRDDDGVVAAEDIESARERVGEKRVERCVALPRDQRFARLGVAHEFQAEERADAAHLANGSMALMQLLES